MGTHKPVKTGCSFNTLNMVMLTMAIFVANYMY